MSSANLHGAKLRGASLSGADLFFANLSNQPFSYPAYDGNLRPRDATVDGAGASGADLTDANLHDANLTGADLRGALGLTQKQFGGAIGDDSTQPPAGLQHPERWSKGAPEDSGA